MLKWAVIHCRAVKIRYASSYGATKERIVEPCKLSYKAKAWYLRGFCTEKQDFRIFKLSRILDFEVLKESFRPHCIPEPIDTFQGECSQITLRFPKEIAYRVYDEFDKTQVQEQPNGDFIASAKMPEGFWLIGYLLSFGSQVEILQPLSLKAAVAEQAKLIYEKNKT